MSSDEPRWPLGSDDMSARIQKFDWAATPLGSIDQWPQSLRTATEVCLGSRLSSVLLWGPEYTLIHNDAYAPVLGTRFPAALGAPAREAIADSWPVLEPYVTRVVESGRSEAASNLVATVYRHGEPSTASFSLSLAPVHDESGRVAGVLLFAMDSTWYLDAERALRSSEERRAFLLAFSDALHPLIDVGEIQATASRLARDRFQSDRCYYCEIEGDRVVIRGESAKPGLAPVTGVYALNTMPIFTTVLARGRTFAVEDVRSTDLVDEQLRTLCVTLDVLSFVDVPVIKHGAAVGLLCIVHASPKKWSESDIALAEDIADRVGTELERARTETALRDSEERFRRIVLTATDYAIFSTDIEFRIETWSPGAEHIFGWTAAEMMGRPAAETYTHEDRAAGVPEKEFRTAQQVGQAPNVRWHARKEGPNVFIEGVAYALRDASGRFRGVFKIGQDVTERRNTDEALRVSEAELQNRVVDATVELRRLSRRLLQVQEEERRHLALELHDDFGQVLSGLSLLLAVDSTDASRLAEARSVVSDLTERIRQRSMELRPATLDAYGLIPALRWLIGGYQRQTEVTVEFLHEGLDRRFSASIEIAVYRIVQEALTNIARHSGATTAAVRLLADDVALYFSVEDNGRGFNPSVIEPGSGIGGMRERVELLAGHFSVDSSPGHGVTITADLPLVPADFSAGAP